MTEQQIEEVMEWAVLACQEAENGDMEAACRCLNSQERMLREYLGAWSLLDASIKPQGRA